MEKKSANVVVLSQNGPASFYVLLEFLLAKEAEFNNFIETEAQKAVFPTSIELNEIYLLQNALDKKWYRVKVEEIIEATQLVQVFYLDYGKTENVDQDELKESSEVVKKLLKRAVKCSLINADQIIREVENAEMKFQFFVSRRERFKMVVHDVIAGVLIVELISLDQEPNFAVSERLRSQPQSPPKPAKKLKQIEIPDGSKVKIRHVNSPADFFVASVDLEPEEKVMQTEMKNFYSSKSTNLRFSSLGGICAYCDKSGVWHRVEVVKAGASDGRWKVLFVDIGREKSVLVDELFELDKHFLDFPKFALRCSLSGVAPVFDSWTEESCEFFEKSFMQPKDCLEMTTFLDGVELSIDFEGIKISASKSLVHWQHAKPSFGTVDVMPFEVVDQVEEEDEFAGDRMHEIEITAKDFNPLDLPVKFTEFQRAEETLSGYIQKIVPDDQKLQWRLGDQCLVFCILDGREVWLRGVILKVKNMFAHVMLSDYGFKVAKQFSCLRKCPPQIIQMNPTFAHIRLAYSFNDELAVDRFEALRNLIQSYNKLYITLKDNNKILLSMSQNPRPAILWGQNEDEGIKNVLKDLEEKGVVVSAFGSQPPKIKSRENWTIVDYMEHEPIPDLYDLSLTEDGKYLINDIPVELKKNRIKSWLPVVPYTRKSSFIGFPTHVTPEGVIIMHDDELSEELEKVDDIVNRFFKDRPDDTKKCKKFKVGDPCLVEFSVDGRFYRGEVVEVKGNSCQVLFIDYGSVRNVKSKYLHAEVICVEVPPFAQKFRLEGVVPKVDGVFDAIFIQKLYDSIVEEKLDVVVHEDDFEIADPKFIKRCGISINHKLMKSYREFQIYAEEYLVLQTAESSPSTD